MNVCICLCEHVCMCVFNAITCLCVVFLIMYACMYVCLYACVFV